MNNRKVLLHAAAAVASLTGHASNFTSGTSAPKAKASAGNPLSTDLKANAKNYVKLGSVSSREHAGAAGVAKTTDDISRRERAAAIVRTPTKKADTSHAPSASDGRGLITARIVTAGCQTKKFTDSGAARATG